MIRRRSFLAQLMAAPIALVAAWKTKGTPSRVSLAFKEQAVLGTEPVHKVLVKRIQSMSIRHYYPGPATVRVVTPNSVDGSVVTLFEARGVAPDETIVYDSMHAFLRYRGDGSIVLPSAGLPRT